MATSTKAKTRVYRRAVGYIAHSSETERVATAEKIAAYCETTGLQLVESFSDERAATSHQSFNERPGGAAVMRAFSSRAVRNLVMLRLHDAFPSTEDLGIQARKLRRRKRAVHVVDLAGSSYNSSRDPNHMFWRMAHEMGRVERRNTREQIAASPEAEKVAGWIRGGVPYGFDRRGTLLLENQKEQQVIVEVRALRASGMSLNKIAARLNELGIPSKKGGKWYSATVEALIFNRSKSPHDKLWRPGDIAELHIDIQVADEADRMKSQRWRKR